MLFLSGDHYGASSPILPSARGSRSMDFTSKASSLNGSFNSDPGYNSSNTSIIHQLENYDSKSCSFHTAIGILRRFCSKRVLVTIILH